MKSGKCFAGILLGVLVCALLLTGCQTSWPNPVLTLKFGGGQSQYEGTVEIELYPDKAPNTVRNIIYLVRQGYFDDMKVNMAVEDSFIEIADGTGFKTLRDTGTVPDYAIEGEFPANGFSQNDLVFERGAVALSRYERSDFNSGSDGFFITLGAFPEAQGEFAVFGKVIRGIEVVEEISRMRATDATLHYEPIYSVKVAQATVALKGGKYEPPETRPRTYYPWNSYNPWWSKKAEKQASPAPTVSPA